MEKFELAAVISSGTVADEAKNDDLDIRPDLDLTCDHFRKNKRMFKKYSSRAFDCRHAHLATATRSRGRQGGGAESALPTPGGAHLAKYPSGALVKDIFLRSRPPSHIMCRYHSRQGNGKMVSLKC